MTLSRIKKNRLDTIFKLLFIKLLFKEAQKASFFCLFRKIFFIISKNVQTNSKKEHNNIIFDIIFVV